MRRGQSWITAALIAMAVSASSHQPIRAIAPECTLHLNGSSSWMISAAHLPVVQTYVSQLHTPTWFAICEIHSLLIWFAPGAWKGLPTRALSRPSWVAGCASDLWKHGGFCLLRGALASGVR